MWAPRLPLLVALIAVVGCSSGNNGGCETSGGMPLVASDWPKFRKDLANTGRSEATIAATQAERWVFPPREMPPLKNGLTSPVIMGDGRVLIVAEQGTFPTVNRVYLIDPDGEESTGSFDVPLISTDSVSPGSAPVISNNRIAVVFTDQIVRQFAYNGTLITAQSAKGPVNGSLTIDHEGTIYTATTSGVYSTLCASGGVRYLLGIGSTESSAALYEGDPITNNDDVSVIASNDGKVRAFKFFRDLLWTFTASSAISASVVYDNANDNDAKNDRVYGADANGIVFAINAVDGRRCHNLINVGAPVVASPAFAGNMLYVVDTTGVLHALSVQPECDLESGMIELWTYRSGASVSSSPAVASSPSGAPVVIFGSDDGTVHAVVGQDTALWTHCTQERGAFGRSSVAIRQETTDSPTTVYVTTAAGRLYALSAGDGNSMPCGALASGTPTATPSASPSPTPTT